jgi:LPXTG-motif cell wall-anchored protein
MTKKTEKPEKTGSNWTGKAALAGAAIGSAALAAALLYASRRKERIEEGRRADADLPESD